jgi:hypothetical protein
LIAGILKADAGEEVGFRETRDAGIRCFPPLLLIRLLGLLVGFLFFIVMAVPIILVGALTCGIGVIPMACALFVAGIFINIWFAFMDYAAVIEKLDVGAAIGRAWSVLHEHLGPILLLWILLFAVSLGMGLGLVVLFIPSGLTLFFGLPPWIRSTGSPNGMVLASGIALFVLFVLASRLVGAVLTVWKTGVMATAYRDLGRATPMLPVSAHMQTLPGENRASRGL